MTVYTETEHIFIQGQNLPRGDGVTVRLGDEQLDVLLATESLVVARLPTGDWRSSTELVVRRGVKKARVRGNTLLWGLRLPNQFR